jgi:hypothetical protein
MNQIPFVQPITSHFSNRATSAHASTQNWKIYYTGKSEGIHSAVIKINAISICDSQVQWYLYFMVPESVFSLIQCTFLLVLPKLPQEL